MNPLRIICIEDSEQDFFLLERSLRKSFPLESFRMISGEAELRASLHSESWDLVLSDFNLPGFSALQALNIVKDFSKDLPFVLITGAIGEEAVVDFLKFGAQDVVLKSNLTRLNFVIERVFRELAVKKKAAEAQRLQELAIKAREEMLAIVSHDLRNPLTAIQLNAQAIEAKIGSEDTKVVQSSTLNAKSIYRSTMRMKNLISDILDKVRLDAGTFTIHKKVMEMKGFISDVEDVFKPLAEEKAIEFEVDPGDCTDITMELDFERLFQILSNLVGNALKFTPPYGKIKIYFKKESKALNVTVEDTGAGIEVDQLDKIFDKYWHNERAGRLGVGLGLSIVKEIITAHGGDIQVTSEKGHGTTFSFWIPAIIQEVVNREALPRDLTSDQLPKILVVEDDDDLREVVESHLQSFGYRVESFNTGKAALDHFDTMKEVPSLVILDYRLTDMTGGEVAEALRDLYPQKNIPIIFLSAETHLDSIAKRYRAATFLTKPLGIRELQQAIERYI